MIKILWKTLKITEKIRFSSRTFFSGRRCSSSSDQVLSLHPISSFMFVPPFSLDSYIYIKPTFPGIDWWCWIWQWLSVLLSIHWSPINELGVQANRSCEWSIIQSPPTPVISDHIHLSPELEGRWRTIEEQIKKSKWIINKFLSSLSLGLNKLSIMLCIR